jgi:hypothetical protein
MRLVRLLTLLFLVVVPLQGVEVPYRIFSPHRSVVVPLQGVEVPYRIFSPHRSVVRRLWVDRRVVQQPKARKAVGRRGVDPAPQLTHDLLCPFILTNLNSAMRICKLFACFIK